MIIYVVQVGDTITSIANKFGVSETRLILENGISNPTDLVIGQTIVITYPQETYIVKEGDNLSEIALDHGISMMQLYRNNPYLWEREYIFPGEELIISYDTKGTITTNAYAFPFIDKNILKKSLPYLTYLSILNYKTLRKGEIESFYDDSDLIETAKQFGVMPLMLVTSVTFRGERNPEMIYEILLNPDYQDNHAESMLKILKEKGYYGVNITFTFLNETNQELYLNYLERITSRLNKEGYPVFITIDPNFLIEENQLLFEKVNYSKYNELIDETYLMRFYWGTQYGPPMPISSIENISLYVNYTKQMMDPKKINVGFPLLGYDWTLPYIEGFSEANAITLDAVIDLARSMKSTILFDEVSKTPYYEYAIETSGRIIQHIVWFVDARTIYAIVNLVLENGLSGTGLWNIMSYYPQLWLIINSNCKIKKLLSEVNQ
ncbi:germination protein [Lacrimispora amygdalina]|uniref:Germination protein n=1 Tax=Lacrimispora amygdalina TaxID=253257 RepID=A0A3E2NAS1_9FIRM|nr:LysM peptidoglycan-binding domain-containing protein [Clostridium indicum]RFZ78086.1 LysM peptidoglycan-binding domain-containing protein [Clostridium indicum]